MTRLHPAHDDGVTPGVLSLSSQRLTRKFAAWTFTRLAVGWSLCERVGGWVGGVCKDGCSLAFLNSC